MDEQIKSRLTSKDIWLRGLYMVFFSIAWGLSEILLVFTVVIQFFTVLIGGSANLPLLRFGQNLSRYHYQMARFVSFNTETRPFPFSDWPEDVPGGERWRDDGDREEPVIVEESADAVGSRPESSPDESDQAVTSNAGNEPGDINESRKDEAPPSA